MVIDHLDLSTKHIYLAVGVTSFHPVEDIYKEIRTIRRTDETMRGFDTPVMAYGNVAKGGAKFTPRYSVFRGGWKIVPEDVSHTLTITGDMITDIEGYESPDNCIDFTPLSSTSKVFVNYAAPEAEIIETGTSGLTEEESEKLMEIATVKAKTDTLPSDPTSKSDLESAHGTGSWEGATPSQVWGHADRKLTSRDIESQLPGEHLPSEEQVLNIGIILNTIEGLDFDSAEDALRVIRQLVQAAGRASFKV